jgi:hypothetical protein
MFKLPKRLLIKLPMLQYPNKGIVVQVKHQQGHNIYESN